MPEIETHAVGSRGTHRDIAKTTPDKRQREQPDTDTVKESKDETPPGTVERSVPGSLEWKEQG